MCSNEQHRWSSLSTRFVCATQCVSVHGERVGMAKRANESSRGLRSSDTVPAASLVQRRGHESAAVPKTSTRAAVIGYVCHCSAAREQAQTTNTNTNTTHTRSKRRFVLHGCSELLQPQPQCSHEQRCVMCDAHALQCTHAQCSPTDHRMESND